MTEELIGRIWNVAKGEWTDKEVWEEVVQGGIRIRIKRDGIQILELRGKDRGATIVAALKKMDEL